MATTTTKTLWIGTEPDPDDRLQIDVSEEDYNRMPERGTGGSRGPVTVKDLRTGKQLMVRRASCGIPHCLCTLELVRWLDPLPRLTEMRPPSGKKMIAHYVVKVFIDDDLTETQMKDAQCNFCGLHEQVERVFQDHAEYDDIDIQVTNENAVEWV